MCRLISAKKVLIPGLKCYHRVGGWGWRWGELRRELHRLQNSYNIFFFRKKVRSKCIPILTFCNLRWLILGYLFIILWAFLLVFLLMFQQQNYTQGEKTLTCFLRAWKQRAPCWVSFHGGF